MKLSASMEKALNEQMVKEFYSAYLYLSMARDMKKLGFAGYSKWLMVQYNEEREHAFKFMEYIEDREGTPEFAALGDVKEHFDCPIKTAEAALHHEEYISDSIRTLYRQAREEDDLETMSLLKWYIDEQVEEEANAHEVVDGFTAGKECKGLMFMFDHHLGERK
jgi:ferritin